MPPKIHIRQGDLLEVLCESCDDLIVLAESKKAIYLKPGMIIMYLGIPGLDFPHRSGFNTFWRSVLVESEICYVPWALIDDKRLKIVNKKIY